MAIQNRDLGVSQQRDSLKLINNAALATGASLLGPSIPYACTVEGVWMGALGLSGSPQYNVNVLRFTSGGATVMALGISNLVVAAALGVSGGMQGWSGIRAAGSSLLLLQAGDVLAVTSAGANTSSEKLVVDVIVKKTADIVKHFSLET